MMMMRVMMRMMMMIIMMLMIRNGALNHRFRPLGRRMMAVRPSMHVFGDFATSIVTILLTSPDHAPYQDTVSEWLRRWTRNPLGSARKGSNPFGVALT